MKEVKEQVKSRERVVNHGEVFTHEREVNAMLDLVKDETDRIDSRFLEPACGDGNFLAEILNRKLKRVNKQYGKVLFDYERFSILVLMNIYGVDILADNVEDCKNRLYKIWEEDYKKTSKDKTKENIKKTAHFILDKNILCGDALTMMQSNGQPIIFSEWSFVMGNMVKRRDFRLDELLTEEKPRILETNQTDMFESNSNWEFDKETNIKMPSPIKEYPIIDYRKVYEVE